MNSLLAPSGLAMRAGFAPLQWTQPMSGAGATVKPSSQRHHSWTTPLIVFHLSTIEVFQSKWGGCEQCEHNQDRIYIDPSGERSVGRSEFHLWGGDTKEVDEGSLAPQTLGIGDDSTRRGNAPGENRFFFTQDT